MPSRVWPIWLYTLLLLIGFPLLNWIYWPQVLEAGVLPPDGDSIGIPMFNSILATMSNAPLVLGFTWLCLSRYNRNARLLAWRTDKPFRTLAISFLFGALILWVGWTEQDLLRSDPIALPWYEYLFPIYLALWLPWLLWLRAAVVERRDTILQAPRRLSLLSGLLVLLCILGAVPASGLAFISMFDLMVDPAVDPPLWPAWRSWASLASPVVLAAGAFGAARLMERPNARRLMLIAALPLLGWSFIAYCAIQGGRTMAS